MIELHQFPRSSEGYNMSPFCLKVEAYLTLAKIPYTEVIDSSLKAPKKKLPFIVHDGKTIADSSMIIDHLKKEFGDRLDAHLSAEQKAQGQVIRGFLEEKFYFELLYSRWIDEQNWPVVETRFFASLKGLTRMLVPSLVRKNVRKTIYLQGMGRHSKTDIYRFAEDDIHTLSTLLGSKKFILGDQLSSFDATAYAFVENMFVPFFESPIRRTAIACQNLVDYAQRMRDLLKKAN